MFKKLFFKIVDLVKFLFRRNEENVPIEISISALKLMKTKFLCLKSTADPDVFQKCFNDILYLSEKISKREKSIFVESEKILKEIYEMKHVPHGNDSECTLYSITFGKRQRTYTYLTNGTSYKEGSCVIVPVGDNNKKQVGKVYQKVDYTKTNVPVDTDGLKKIITHAVQ